MKCCMLMLLLEDLQDLALTHCHHSCNRLIVQSPETYESGLATTEGEIEKRLFFEPVLAYRGVASLDSHIGEETSTWLMVFIITAKSVKNF